MNSTIILKLEEDLCFGNESLNQCNTINETEKMMKFIAQLQVKSVHLNSIEIEQKK